MTRKAHIKQVHKSRTEKNRAKVLNITAGMFSDEYKKKNGKWKITLLSKELGLSINTIKKYLKESA